MVMIELEGIHWEESIRELPLAVEDRSIDSCRSYGERPDDRGFTST